MRNINGTTTTTTTYSTKIRTSGNRTSGDRTSGGPPVVMIIDHQIKFTYEKYNSTLQSCLRDGLERKKLQYEVLNQSFLQFELFIT